MIERRIKAWRKRKHKSGRKNMEGGGTEAFPDLGRHCQYSDCHQLDFLPFNCDRCQKVFCLDHRESKSHECPKSDLNSRKVVVCEICSISIETTGRSGEDEKMMLKKHEKSGDCDPMKKKKPTCGVRRCKEVLTFSNTNTCKTCQLKVCLRHRFPADHECKKAAVVTPSVVAGGRWNEKFLAALSIRNGKDCAKDDRRSSSTATNPSVKAY